VSVPDQAGKDDDASRPLQSAAQEDTHLVSPNPKKLSVSRIEVAGQEKGVSRLRVTGVDLRQMLAMGTTLLEENVETVNALNVFPVPDGDTGTNMLLTMQSAMEEISRAAAGDFGPVAHAAAHGALMGARGNSGVILSQILRGIARAADGKESLDASEWAAALKEGANTAYRGIGKPVEGTILTVARESADAAVAASQQGRSLVHVLRRAVDAAQTSLDATPTLLATLREAGVVDAGGQGYLLILEGAQLYLSGERTPAPVVHVRRPVQEASTIDPKKDYGYCTEVLIRGEGLQVDKIREQLEAVGSSVIVVGEPNVVHIHVHTHQPGEVLSLAGKLGTMDKIKVENMQVQHTSYVASRNTQQPADVAGVGVVAVVAGTGLAKVFRDLGTGVVVHGGQTMNPSIEELVHAAASSGHESVILLPNNPNIVLTAQQSQTLVENDLKVVPTRTVCEGIAAMVAFNPETDLETNVAAMTEAASAIQTIELTRAVRSTKVNGLQVLEGQAIGMLNGALVEASDSVADTVLNVLQRARVSEHEVVTVYRGEGISEAESSSLVDSISERWPEVQVEVVDGGQPYYPYIISVE
jgi:uncharacterized protein